MRTVLLIGSCLLAPILASAASPRPCPRFEPGSSIVEPEDLYSRQGQLAVTFQYRTRVDSYGNTLYCFTTPEGVTSPTLHVQPGDHLKIRLINQLAPGTAMTMDSMPGMTMAKSYANVCGDTTMNTSATNLHFHGTNVAPVCHQDEVIQTTVNGGSEFDYDVQFPDNEPPGLYWYHPHIHGISEPAVLGGASGAIVVEGLQNVNPLVAGLPQRILIVRDNLVPGDPAPGGAIPSWDVSVNYVPVPSPTFTPALLSMKPNERQLWRVLNASADTILDVELDYDGTAQTLQVVGLDGVPTGSQDGTSRGKTFPLKHILLAPAGRAEFVVTGPSSAVQHALLQTRNIDTGPDGDNDPARPLVAIQTSPSATEDLPSTGEVSGPPPVARFAALAQAKVTATRKLYFSEVLSDPNDPNSPTNFYITVDGQTPTLFNPDNPPSIETNQGSVEDWTIENRALENHIFHIHQIHFLVLAVNGVPVANGQFLDTKEIPYWSGTGPYPSIKVRMDFRGQTVGDFVYHCHILGHEDGGMMAIIRVKPATGN